MSTRCRSLFTHLGLPVLAALLLAREAPAGVRVLDSTGQTSFASLSAAVQGADPGATLIVGEGVYRHFEIDKPLQLFAAPGATVEVLGWMKIRDVDEGRVVVRGLRFKRIGRSWFERAITVENCSADVRVSDCTVPEDPVQGGGGARVVASTSVVFHDCYIEGFRGSDCDDEAQYPSSGWGGTGLELDDGSNVALLDCQVEGGDADFTCFDSGAPGIAVDVGEDCFLFASGSRLVGNGAYYLQYCLEAAPTATIETLDTTIIGGTELSPGAVWIELPGSARSFDAPEVTAHDVPLVATVEGQPGDRIRFLPSSFTDFEYRRALGGPWLQPPLTFLPTGFDMPRIPAGGTATIELHVPELAPTEPAVLVSGQGLVYERPHRPRLSNAIDTLVINRDAIEPDCNGNGIGDLVEMLDGTSADVNRDWVPDECQYLGPRWYVQASAAPGGDGSAGSPFRTLREGMDHALAGHEVIVANGVYTGPDNRNLDFVGRDFVVRSANGPAACIIDCEEASRAVHAYFTETSAAVLRGFTIRNAGYLEGGVWKQPYVNYGASIRVDEPAGLSVEDCVIEDSQAFNLGSGEAIFAFRTPFSRFRNCTIRTDGGSAVRIEGGHTQIIESTIEGHSGTPIYLHNTATTLFSGTRIRDNGTGLRIRNSHVTFDNCLIANNISRGVYLDRAPRVFFRNSAIVGNSVGGGGGAALWSQTNQDGRDIRFENTIVWGNSPAAQCVMVQGQGDSTLSVERCDVQGGQSAFLYLVSGQVTPFPFLAIDADPSFVDLVDYRLGPGSPCIDAGDNALAPPDSADVDDDGNTLEPVPFDFDHRARFLDDPSVPDSGAGSPPLIDIGPHEHRP